MYQYRMPVRRSSRYASRGHTARQRIAIAFGFVVVAAAFAFMSPDLQDRRFYMSAALPPALLFITLAFSQTRLFRRRFATGVSYHIPRMAMYSLVVLMTPLLTLLLIREYRLEEYHQMFLVYESLLLIGGCMVKILDHLRSYLRQKWAADKVPLEEAAE
jgi:hypothetical protein